MRKTRKEKAHELLRTLQGGPDMEPRERLSAARIRIWLDSWVIGPVLDLVPEFKVREPEPEPQPTERDELVSALRELHRHAKEKPVLTGNGVKAVREAGKFMAALKRSETVLARYREKS